MLFRVFLLLLNLATAAFASNQVCYPVVGCFTNDYPFHNMPLPESPDDVQVSMTVYSRSNRDVGQVITPTTIPFAFDRNNPTVFLVHGFLGSHHNNWLHDMKNDILVVGNYNVIITGWRGGSMTIWYPQAASNTQVVGGWMAAVADNLVNRGRASYSDFYCAGHSLGSHICGQQGGRVQGTFNRITGLDPAGPWFENNDWSNGLNPGRATWVEVIHTNGEGGLALNLGTFKPLGDVDFYPNGGGRQPGCIFDPLAVTASNDPDYEIDPSAACSHMRVLDLYLHSIRTNCFAVHREACSDAWNTPGSCGPRRAFAVQRMGFHSYPQYTARGNYWLETRSSHPWCV